MISLNLKMDERNGEQYKSKSQKIRAITETWAESNMFCPYCGNRYIYHFENNRPVADFFCPSCREEYELKSNGTSIGKKVNDGAYKTEIFVLFVHAFHYLVQSFKSHSSHYYD